MLYSLLLLLDIVITIVILLCGSVSYKMLFGLFFLLPSDTETLLTIDCSEEIIVEEELNFTTCSSLKRPFFPVDFDSAGSLKNYER